MAFAQPVTHLGLMQMQNKHNVLTDAVVRTPKTLLFVRFTEPPRTTGPRRGRRLEQLAGEMGREKKADLVLTPEYTQVEVPIKKASFTTCRTQKNLFVSSLRFKFRCFGCAGPSFPASHVFTLPIYPLLVYFLGRAQQPNAIPSVFLPSLLRLNNP